MRYGLVAMLAGFLMASPAASSADGDTRPCRTYRAAMQTARDALAHGDRAAALTALEQAKALLQQCRREEAHNLSLLAATHVTARDV